MAEAKMVARITDFIACKCKFGWIRMLLWRAEGEVNWSDRAVTEKSDGKEGRSQFGGKHGTKNVIEWSFKSRFFILNN